LFILKQKMMSEGKQEEDIENEFLDIIYEIERGILNMEKRIAHIDTEHSKYVRATVSRLEYLLSNDDSVQGNVVTLLNLLSAEENSEILSQVSDSILINDLTIISNESLYKKRGKHKVFEETVEVEEEVEEELSKEAILQINKNKNRYSQVQIEQFIIRQMDNGMFHTKEYPITTDEEFELLILAYDYSMRKKSPLHVVPGVKGTITSGKYTYPDMIFERNEI